ncbi:hypothetical protein GCM10027080_34650 [Pedococcus soli]
MTTGHEGVSRGYAACVETRGPVPPAVREGVAVHPASVVVASTSARTRLRPVAGAVEGAADGWRTGRRGRGSAGTEEA